MEKEKSEFYEIAKRIIVNKIKKVIKNRPQLLEKGDIEEIEIQTEALLIKQLTAKVNISTDLSDDTEKVVQYTLNVFDREFDNLCREVISEKKAERQEKTDRQIPENKEEKGIEI